MAITIGFQGIEGAYSQSAALDLVKSARLFAGETIETVPCPSFKDVFERLSNGAIKFAVVPIENTHSGTFHSIYDLFIKHKVFINGEYMFQDKHCLLGLPGASVEGLKQIYSHPHVLDQCSNFVGHLKGVECIPTEDTAGAAAHVKSLNRPDAAAIASRKAAETYGLEVLKEGIEDDNRCATRYVLLSTAPLTNPPGDTEFRTSLAVSLKNAPGQLYKVLSCFALRDINITKIESRPSTRSSPTTVSRVWEYLMYIDVDGSTRDKAVENAINNVREFSTTVHLLGSYPRFRPINDNRHPMGVFGL